MSTGPGSTPVVPRSNPETRPILAGVQLMRRSGEDRYGNERAHWGATIRPVRTRNGLPVSCYRYQGTGQSMSADEAEWWLTA